MAARTRCYRPGRRAPPRGPGGEVPIVQARGLRAEPTRSAPAPTRWARLVLVLAAAGLAACSATGSGGGRAGSPSPLASRTTGDRPTGAPSAVVLPRPGARWDYQIGGATRYSPAPDVVSRDHADRPWPGVYSICYVNAFQSQPGDASLRSAWLTVDNAPVEDPGWPGEYVLDTRGHRAQLVSAFTVVLRHCATAGFRAVELDNLDSWERSAGGLTRADNVAYARELVSAAHRLGLAAAQKNAAQLVGAVPFDLAVTESCLRFDECGTFTAAYRVVLDVEYTDELSAQAFQAKCSAAVSTLSAVSAGTAPSFVLRDRGVTPTGVRKWCSAQHP